MSTVCVHCCHPTELLEKFSASSDSFKLLRCTRCNCFADSYIEMDVSMQLLDLALHRKSIYRHCFFNLSSVQRLTLHRLLLRITPVFIFLDSFSNWSFESPDRWVVSPFFYFDFNGGTTDTIHISILAKSALRLLLLLVLLSVSTSVFLWTNRNDDLLGIAHDRSTIGRIVARSTSLFFLLLLASMGKLLTVLVLVWPFPSFIGRTIDLIVSTSQITAISGLLFCELPAILLISTENKHQKKNKASCSCSCAVPFALMMGSYWLINIII